LFQVAFPFALCVGLGGLGIRIKGHIFEHDLHSSLQTIELRRDGFAVGRPIGMRFILDVAKAGSFVEEIDKKGGNRSPARGLLLHVEEGKRKSFGKILLRNDRWVGGPRRRGKSIVDGRGCRVDGFQDLSLTCHIVVQGVYNGGEVIYFLLLLCKCGCKRA